MSAGLYMDVHAITRGLRRRAVDVLTAQDDGTVRLPDPDLLDRATELNRLLFSMDIDLVTEAVRRQRAGEPFATVIFAQQLETSIGRCITDLESLCQAAAPEDLQGQVIFL